MPKRSVEVVILCEDTQQEVFVRCWLEKKGFNPRKFRIRKSPGSKGSAEQFVRIHYPAEVQAQRQKASYSPVGSSLVVAVDADILTVDLRKQMLDQQLETSLQQKRQLGEKIALLIPKRNIETWIYHLRGQTVDEETAYPKSSKEEGNCKADVEKLAMADPQNPLVVHAPLSLQIAITELQRIV
jgi:hypothetical protein